MKKVSRARGHLLLNVSVYLENSDKLLDGLHTNTPLTQRKSAFMAHNFHAVSYRVLTPSCSLLGDECFHNSLSFP